jgi:tetratricopeptide (TPR) repeat protein
MKKSVIIISLFLLGTTFSVKAQEMTQKEKTGYAIGIILGQKIKETNIDLSVFESIKEKIDEKIHFESVEAGVSDILKGQSKLSKDEIETILAELAKEKDILEKMLNANQSDGNEREAEKPESAVARTLGTLSWNYLFIKDYKQSEQSARQALKLDNTQTWVKVNLAHALLFQNRFSEAEKIYKELSQTIMKGDGTYTQTLLIDLEELERAGVIPEKCKASVEKIRKILRE